MKRRKKNFVKQVQRNNYKYIVPILRIILLKNGEKKNFDSMILEQEKNKNKILIFNFGINKYFTLLLTLFSILFVMYNIIIDNISNVCFNLTIYIYIQLLLTQYRIPLIVTNARIPSRWKTSCKLLQRFAQFKIHWQNSWVHGQSLTLVESSLRTDIEHGPTCACARKIRRLRGWVWPIALRVSVEMVKISAWIQVAGGRLVDRQLRERPAPGATPIYLPYCPQVNQE